MLKDNAIAELEDSQSFAGAPTFNEKTWDFDGSRERLYGQIAVVDRAFNFTFPSAIFSDPDAGDTLTYSATLVNGDLPSWLTVNSTTGKFTGKPDTIGNLDIQLIATDSGGESDRCWSS